MERCRFSILRLAEFYPDAQEEIPINAPSPRGNPIQINVFVDASHANKNSLVAHTQASSYMPIAHPSSGIQNLRKLLRLQPLVPNSWLYALLPNLSKVYVTNYECLVFRWTDPQMFWLIMTPWLRTPPYRHPHYKRNIMQSVIILFVNQLQLRSSGLLIYPPVKTRPTCLLKF